MFQVKTKIDIPHFMAVYDCIAKHIRLLYKSTYVSLSLSFISVEEIVELLLNFNQCCFYVGVLEIVFTCSLER